MRRAGVLETTIMAITGHRTRNMFDRYNIVDEQDIRDAVVKTTAYVSTLSAASTVIPLHPVEATGRRPRLSARGERGHRAVPTSGRPLEEFERLR